MTSLTRSSVARHERKSCKMNPLRRSCWTCRHSRREWVSEDGYGYGLFAVNGYNSWVCDAIEEFQETQSATDCKCWERKET